MNEKNNFEKENSILKNDFYLLMDNLKKYLVKSKIRNELDENISID